MNTNTVEIKLDIDETILVSMKENKDEFKETLLFYTAYSLYRKGKLSLGKAPKTYLKRKTLKRNETHG
jgi:hypothetical protein